MPTIEKVPDVELIEHLEFEVEHPCNVVGCSRKADLIGCCKTCKFTFDICLPCVLQRQLIASWSMVFCNNCYAACRNIRDLFDFTPIGGK